MVVITVAAICLPAVRSSEEVAQQNTTSAVDPYGLKYFWTCYVLIACLVLAFSILAAQLSGFLIIRHVLDWWINDREKLSIVPTN
jgi:hypothetical protein